MLFLLCSSSPCCPLSSMSFLVCVYSVHTAPSRLPWMLMEATDYLLGFGLAWPYRPLCKSMLRLSLQHLCPSFFICFLSLLSLFCLFFFYCLSFFSSHTFVSLCPKLWKHFRIFWSSSVLGWWHGTSVASLSDLCPQRACSKWFRPLLQNDSHTLVHAF